MEYLFGRMVILMVVMGSSLYSQYWEQWRGPGRNAILADNLVPAKWPDSLLSEWGIEVGEGYGSPVTDGQRVYLLTRIENMEVVSAIRLSDCQPDWQDRYPAPFRTNQYALKFGKGPFSTLTIAGDKIVSLGIGGVLSVYGAGSGEVLWRKHFSEDTLNTAHYFVGSAMSPLVNDGVVYVHLGEETAGSLNAYDLKDGRLIWQWEEDLPGYASPILLPGGESGVLATLTQQHFAGIDAASGQTRWLVPFSSEWRENIPTPVLCDSLIITSGVKRGIMAYRYDKTVATIDTNTVWHKTDVSLYMSSPVYDGRRLFGFSHIRKGQFFAMNPNSGQIVWISEGRQAWNASLVVAGPWLLALTDSAELLAMDRHADTFTVIQKYRLGDGASWGYPLIAGGRILVKTGRELVAFGLSGNSRN